LFKEYGYGSTIWSPLYNGMLTGKYNKGIPAGSRASLPDFEWIKEKVTDKENLNKVIKLGKVADDVGIPMAHMAIAWILKNPNVSTVITGSSKLGQLKENLKAIDAVEKLTPDVMEKIAEILDN
jgi:aryl-alcohol dehydrogenase-like predicted oxidoreductase